MESYTKLYGNTEKNGNSSTQGDSHGFKAELMVLITIVY